MMMMMMTSIHRAVLACLWALGPPSYGAPIIPMALVEGGSRSILYQRIRQYTLDPNHCQTWCQITIYEM